MKDDGLILAAWSQHKSSPAVLATVVKVSGSSYRSPGARMLITENGGRTGSISGGCLEGDVIKKAWWLTGESRAAIRVYDNTSDDDAIWAFGLGCNGIVHVLLERWDAGSQPLTIDLLQAVQPDSRGGVLATVISGDAVGQKLARFPDGHVTSGLTSPELESPMEELSREAFDQRRSRMVLLDGIEVFVEYVAPPVALIIVGAGQDAIPVVRFAKELGWHVTVLDGRSNVARPERFPEADVVRACDLRSPLAGLTIDHRTVAVLMSHSYEQDSAYLAAFHSLPLQYLGVLGPRKRTNRMLDEFGLADSGALHSPVGLDIGADTPEEIALAIVSEIQAVLRERSGAMLREKPGPIHSERRSPVISPSPDAMVTVS